MNFASPDHNEWLWLQQPFKEPITGQWKASIMLAEACNRTPQKNDFLRSPWGDSYLIWEYKAAQTPGHWFLDISEPQHPPLVHVDENLTKKSDYPNTFRALVAEAARQGAIVAEGRKDDKGKARLDLLPTKALGQVAQVLAFGAKKYGEENWRQVSDGRKRYYAALLRHVFAWAGGEVNDPETGLPHLAHAGCCLLFLLEVTP